MTDRISPGQARALRAHAQHLRPKAARGDLINIVRSLGGVNAQFKPAMLLSLRARIRDLEAADVDDAIRRRRLVRTWAMRGTIHLFHPDDPGRILPLLGPPLIKKGAGRRRELGLDDKKLSESLAELPSILGGEPLTRGEIVGELARRGIAINPDGQAPYHLAAYAGLKGIIRIGPDRPGGDQTYLLADGRGSTQGPSTRALAGFAHRYLESYGPAGLKDFISWSGLSPSDAKKGWEMARENFHEVQVEGRVLWSMRLKLPDEAADTVVSLLPAFDTLVLGYADRGLLVPEKYRKEVYHGGQIVPVVLVDGLASGTWRYERRGKKLNIRVRPFEAFGREAALLIKEEADDIGRFMGLGQVDVSGL